MTRRVKHPKSIIAEIDARHIFEPEVNAHGHFVQVVAFVHGDVIIAGRHF